MGSTDFKILKVIEVGLVETILNNDRDYNYFHPSEWDSCHRKIAYHTYEAKGYLTVSKSAIKVDTQLQRIFDNGHSMHSRWGAYMEKTGRLRGKWLCQNFMKHKEPMIFGEDNSWGVLKPSMCECGSTRFKYVELGFMDEETSWGGHVDAIFNVSDKFLDDPSVGDLLVVDYKTMNPYEFDKLTAPKPAHMTQMQIYLYLSKLTAGKFLYENKSNQAVKEFLVPRDDSFIEVKKSEALRLRYIVEHTNHDGERVLPQRAYGKKGHPECLRCKFRGACWGK